VSAAGRKEKSRNREIIGAVTVKGAYKESPGIMLCSGSFALDHVKIRISKAFGNFSNHQLD